MKRNIILWIAVSAVVMLMFPWLAATFVKSDAGMAVCLFLFFAVNPVYSMIIGVFAGKNIRHLGSLPVISAALFLIGTWMFFDMGKTAFILYTADWGIRGQWRRSGMGIIGIAKSKSRSLTGDKVDRVMIRRSALAERFLMDGKRVDLGAVLCYTFYQWKILWRAYIRMFTIILYGTAILGLLISFVKDRSKTKLVLKKAWRSLENILPSILVILLLIGFILTFLDAQAISKLIGTDSGVLGMVIAATVGCVTLIPGFVAFPLAASLLSSGAGYAQIAIFISTLMMVGIATLPLEMNCFGKRIALKRNILSLILAVITSCVIGVIMS